MIQRMKVSAYMPMEAGETFYVRGLNGRVEERWDVQSVRRFEDGTGIAKIAVEGFRETSKL